MSWICPKCETENPDGLKVCEVCDSPRIEEPVEEIKKIYTHPAYVGFMKFHYKTMKDAHYGNASAQYELAEWLRKRKTGDEAENRKMAVQWYFKAAIRGIISAQYWLAYHYEVGIGTEKNLVEAKKWFLKAAQKGHTISQYELGLIYEKEGNYEAAKKWYGSVAARGNKDALKKLAMLGKTEDALEEGKTVSVSEGSKSEARSTSSTSSSKTEDNIGRIFVGIIVGIMLYYVTIDKTNDILREYGITVSIPDGFWHINPVVLLLYVIVCTVIILLFDND